MTTSVVFSSEFGSDLAAQTEYLIAQERGEWASRLMDEIEEVTQALAAHPELGTLEVQRPEVRKVVLPKLPFVIFYHRDRAKQKITVLRLFHARQRRPL